MLAALLSPGPSLVGFRGRRRDGYALVVAVNRAVLYAPPHWWSCQDAGLFREVHGQIPPPMPRLWTVDQTLRQLGREGLEPAGRMYVRSESWDWSRFSATAALELCRRLGATRIDCYGCDMGEGVDQAGATSDWDGTRREGDFREPARWELERGVWGATVMALSIDGVEVRRFGADGGLRR